MAAEAAGDEAVTKGKGTLTFLDLPAETQQEIISHCSQGDLICIALVSKHFHELASAQLYRTFHIVFPDDDDLNFDSPIDGLAGGLDTFTTSDYNYARHLKDLSMDTLSAGSKGEISYQSYLYSASCGKFLNTLLYLTLKKAKSLEAFRWNIRVELSRPVYRELHRISSLNKLHIRMQAGESYYTPPPPLPASADTHAVGHSIHWADIPPLSPTPLPVVSLNPTSNMISFLGGPPPPAPPLVPSSKSLPKSKAARRGPPSGEPSTLSGFKNLKCLSVLDIDDLDIVTELKTCVRNSSSTLNELHLSLSDSLALQARKPPPESDPDDSDLDDDFQVVPSSHNNAHSPSEPARTYRAQEERKVQEAVLGRIFDVEHLVNKKSPQQVKPNDKELTNSEGNENQEHPDHDPREDFITSIRSVSTQLLNSLNGSGDISASQQEILDTIEKASRKYVDSGNLPGDLRKPDKPKEEGSSKETKKEDAKNSDEQSTIAKTPSEAPEPSGSQSVLPEKSSTSAGKTGTDIDATVSVFGSAVDQSSSKGKGIAQKESSLDDIDMTHVPSNESSDESDDQKPVESADKKGALCEPATKQGSSIDTLARKLEQTHIKTAASEAKDPISSGENVPDAAQTTSSGSEPAPSSMSDYVRDTRGYSLESLSLHLIPVKPSVLSRAVDLHSLRQLTLLNVGNQIPIWNMLSKENKTQSLQLRSIFTDHVSSAFLTFVSQLDELHELFMLERSMKHKPESFAPRSTVTIDQIRRLALAKHMPTLKRLMIKNESTGNSWDANEKAMIQICCRGKQLEELAVSMNIQSVHAFLQYFSGLVNLRALHILHFKNNDTCIWVMREILRFIVDNLSHHPDLKLEWIGMEDDRVDRVTRPSEQSEESREETRKKQKGKGKAINHLATPSAADNFPILPSIEVGSDSESDDDLDMFGTGTKLRFKTFGPMQFYDVWGVKIFEKEIRSGRL